MICLYVDGWLVAGNRPGLVWESYGWRHLWRTIATSDIPQGGHARIGRSDAARRSAPQGPGRRRIAGYVGNSVLDVGRPQPARDLRHETQRPPGVSRASQPDLYKRPRHRGLRI